MITLIFRGSFWRKLGTLEAVFMETYELLQMSQNSWNTYKKLISTTVFDCISNLHVRRTSAAFWTGNIVHLMGARGVTQPVHGWNKAFHRSCFLMFHLPVLYFRWQFFNLLSLYINIYIYKLLYRTSRHTIHTYTERLKSKINLENPTPYLKLSFSWVYTKKSLPKIKYIQC